jgi:hypothetical protein
MAEGNARRSGVRGAVASSLRGLGLVDQLMRNPVLESAWAKLDRAREHVVAQKAETDKIVKRPWPQEFPFNPDPDTIPYTLRLVPDPDSTDRFRVTVATVMRFPTFVSTIVGDALSDFRGVLDHLAWQLVQLGATPNLSVGAERLVQFPIHTTKGEFDESLGHRLPGIDPVHEAIVRRHQPYRIGNLASEHPLSLLQDLNNIDKHREIRPLLLLPTNYELTPVPGTPDCQVLGIEPGPDRRKALRVGAVIAYIRVADRAACKPTLRLKTKTTMYVALRDDLILDETLNQIGGSVEGVLSEFDPIV